VSRKVRNMLNWAPALVYMGLIYYLSSLSHPPSALVIAPDYVLHGVEYFVLYVLVFLAMHEGLHRYPGRGSFWVPAVFAVLYGMLDEYHQKFVPNRDASIRDLLADMVGVGVGVPFVLLSDRVMNALRAKEI
jgi:VanZ family protein